MTTKAMTVNRIVVVILQIVIRLSEIDLPSQRVEVGAEILEEEEEEMAMVLMGEDINLTYLKAISLMAIS